MVGSLYLSFFFRFALKETPSGGRKKIIPVGSDFEGSPSPETPSSPVTPSPAKIEEEDDTQKKKGKFGLKWKSKSNTFDIKVEFVQYVVNLPN